MSQTLPEPTAIEQAHSKSLAKVIVKEIDQNGSIPFSRYMEMALYQPGLGYYVAGATKFGAAGDFITAPEISPLFGMCIANQAAEVIRQIGVNASLLEIGAGSGVLAVAILKHLDELGCLPQHYFILELSPELKLRQKDIIEKEAPALIERIIWLDTLVGFSMQGMVVANEVLDAMPVSCFEMTEDNIYERRVVFDDRLNWQSKLADERLRMKVEDLSISFVSSAYRSEINLHIQPWLDSMALVIESGVVLLVDYGYQQHEYYHPERVEGTLLAHYRHHAVEDPFVYPGLMDITANVDFTAVAQAAVESGFEVSGYTTQACFLLGAGIDQLFLQCASESEQKQLEYSQQVKHLTLPSEMGERFKVLGINRHFDHSLSAFNFKDLTHKL